MTKNTEKQEDFDLDTYLHNHPEKTQACLVIFVKNNIRELVRWVISNQHKQGLTYEQISEHFQLNRSTLFRIENNQFWPKNDKKQKLLIKKALDLINPEDQNGI